MAFLVQLIDDAMRDLEEICDIGIREYREIFSRPYRIIYRAMKNNVYVLLIADGRRDMQTLLQRRLLWA